MSERNVDRRRYRRSDSPVTSYDVSTVDSTTVCLEIKKSFVLDSARTWLEIWNRVDRGPFTIQGQKGNEIGRVVPKLSTISW